MNNDIDKNNKLVTPRKQGKSQTEDLENNKIYSTATNSNSNYNSVVTPSKITKFKKVESTPLKSSDNKNEKLLKSSTKKKKYNNTIINSPSLATPYLFKQNLIKKFREVDNLKIRIEALRELIEYFKVSKVNKLGSSLQINEGIMSFINDTSDEILGEILDEQTLDILLKTRVILVEQLIPKIIDVEIKIKKQKEIENQNNDNNNENYDKSDTKNLYSEFAINKIKNIINWLKNEIFTVPIMRNIIVELIAKNGKSRKKYNNVNEILESLLEWVIELLINDMSENIFYMNNKPSKELEIDYKIGKRNPCIYFKNDNNLKSIILLLGKWISTTFGNEINGRSLISFLWCIKKLNNKTLKYIKEYFSTEIYDQLIKGIEILDNEFEKSKEMILSDNVISEQENINENKENFKINDNVQDNQKINNSLMSENINKNENNNNSIKSITVNSKQLNSDNNANIEDKKVYQLDQKIEENIINENQANESVHMKGKDSQKMNENDTNDLYTDNVKSSISLNKDENEKLDNRVEKKSEKPRNTLMMDIMEIDEKYNMLPEETFSSSIPDNKSMIIDKSFVTHRNIKLSDIIEPEKSFISGSDKKNLNKNNSNNDGKISKLKNNIIDDAIDLKGIESDINNKDKLIETKESVKTNLEPVILPVNDVNDKSINNENKHIKHIIDDSKNELSNDKPYLKDMENDQLNEITNNDAIINIQNKIPDKKEIKKESEEVVFKKIEEKDSKINIQNVNLDKKEIGNVFLEKHETVKIKEEPVVNSKPNEIKESNIIDTKIKVEKSPFKEHVSKKVKINQDMSKSVILLENSDLIFEKENPRRKIRTYSKDESIIILDDEIDSKPNIKSSSKIKENNIIVIDNDNENENDKINIKIENNDEPNTEEKRIVKIKDNDTNVNISDNDQDTPKNDFETNINENKKNMDISESINDDTMNMNESPKDVEISENKKLEDNINIDEIILINENINKNERNSVIVTPKSSKISYSDIDFFSDNFSKYKKPFGIDKLFIEETPNAKYFTTNIDKDELFINLYNNLKSEKIEESVFRNLIRLSNIQQESNIPIEKLTKINELWSSWFERIYLVLIQKLQVYNNNTDEQEYILLLLQSLMKNQSVFFKGKENGLYCLINQYMYKKPEEIYITTENTLKVYSQYLDKVSCLKSILNYLNRQFSFNVDSNSFYDQNMKLSYRSTSESFAFENLSQIIARFNQNELQKYLNDIQLILSKGLSSMSTDIRRTVIDCCICIHKILREDEWIQFFNKFTLVNQVLIKIFIDQLRE